MWLEVGPSAGGLAPLWQLEHWLATTACVWFQFVGVQPVTRWQLAQLAAVGMCTAFLPVALVPLWQLVQVVAVVKVLWSTLAPLQVEVVLWQLSQLPVTVACTAVAGLLVSP
jgi:hypothetical protein